MSKDTPQTTALERERDAALAELERAYQTLAVLGVPKERAKSVANGIDVLVSRLHRQSLMLMEELAKAEQALRDGLLDKKLCDVNLQLNMEIDSAAQVNTILRKERDQLAEALRETVKTPAQPAVEPVAWLDPSGTPHLCRGPKDRPLYLEAPPAHDDAEDARRLDWLAKNTRMHQHRWLHNIERFASLRAAIDAAMDAAHRARADAEDARKWPIDGGQALMCPDRSGAICGYPRECLERGCKRERK